MGFGREARRVRDVSLPLGHRFHALGSCIQLAQPIGFQATWSYLQAKLERDRRDPGILVPALDLLTAERAIHLGVAEEYRQFRRGQKAVGCRFPRRTDTTPRDPMRWHGDERTGARHLLLHWSQHRRRLFLDSLAPHPIGRLAVDAVNGSLTVTPTPADLHDLQPVLDWARRQIHVVGWGPDQDQYRLASDTHRLLGQLHVPTHGATPVGAPWNFASVVSPGG